MRALIIVIVALGVAVFAGAAAGQQVGPIPGGRVNAGTLSFDAYATVGDFTGATSTVSGEMTGGPDLGAVRGWVEAPVQTLKTGNGKRDRDLNKSMESDKYPTLRFDLTGVTPSPARAPGAPPDSSAVTLLGIMSIHGVRRRVELPATVVLRGTEARIRSDFPLNVKDYGIGGLSRLAGILRMNERIRVHVDLTFQLQSAVERVP